MERDLLISVVIPVFNEADNIEPLADELDRAFVAIEGACEVIFVDDGSNDGGGAIAERLAAERAGYRAIRHDRNCGQSAALATGLRAARGALLATMDGDRQNDPRDLSLLLGALTGDVDCVTGVRKDRQDSTIKRASSRIANAVRNTIVGERVLDAGCTYRIMRRQCFAELPVFNGMHRFVPTMLRMQGYRVVEVAIGHRPRMAGVTKYGVNDRLWRGVRDCFAMRWYRRRVIPGRRTAVAPCRQD